MDKGKQPSQGEWVTIAKKAKEPQQRVYVVFTGRQPGIYHSWPECHKQVNQFPGACYQSYDSMTKARKTYYSTSPMPLLNKQFKHMPRFVNTQISKPNISEIPYFFNPNLPDDIYK